MSTCFQAQLGALSRALEPLAPLPPHSGADPHVFELAAAHAQGSPSIRNRIVKILTTVAGGVPPQFDNAWHWASAWVLQNGVTLPPDTNEYRSLRNWFCYQVNMHKKGTLSARSQKLLNQYGIDLSQYRAPNTGRGELLDDNIMLGRLRLHHEITGSYDLPPDGDAELIEWQSRLLQCYVNRGTSARMRAIEAQLKGFSFGLWMRPNETPIPSCQLGWWARASEFRAASRDFPAFRGRIDPRMPRHIATWGSDQISDALAHKITTRQRGELIALGLLTIKEHARSKEREIALSKARQALSEVAITPNSLLGRRERDLKTFLGVTLLARLLQRNAPLHDIYSSLSIPPAQFEKVRKALEPAALPLIKQSDKHVLSELRSLYRSNAPAFDGAHSVQELPASLYEGLTANQKDRVVLLANLLLEVRDTMRQIGVRQDIPETDSNYGAASSMVH